MTAGSMYVHGVDARRCRLMICFDHQWAAVTGGVKTPSNLSPVRREFSRSIAGSAHELRHERVPSRCDRRVLGLKVSAVCHLLQMQRATRLLLPIVRPVGTAIRAQVPPRAARYRGIMSTSAVKLEKTDPASVPNPLGEGKFIQYVTGPSKSENSTSRAAS
jgi:hypothetical protein